AGAFQRLAGTRTKATAKKRLRDDSREAAAEIASATGFSHPGQELAQEALAPAYDSARTGLRQDSATRTQPACGAGEGVKPGVKCSEPQELEPRQFKARDSGRQ